MSIASVAGYAELSIASILEVAEVRRRTFNAMFAGKDDAFLAAYRELVGQLADELAAADDPGADPTDRVATGLAATVAFLLADPVRAEVALLEVHAAGADAVAVQRAGVAAIVDRTAAMLVEAGAGDEAGARLGAELAIGAVHDALRACLHRGELARLPALVPDLARAAFPMLTSEAVRLGR